MKEPTEDAAGVAGEQHPAVRVERRRDPAQGHGEAVLDVTRAPTGPRPLDLRPDEGRDVGVGHDLGGVAGPGQAMDRLPHLADGPAFEAEAGWFPAFVVDWLLEALGWYNGSHLPLIRQCLSGLRRFVH